MQQPPTSANPPAASRWRRRIIEILIFLAGMLAFQVWQSRNAPHGAAPEITGQTLSGAPFSLADWRAAHPDQPALIYFWAGWCGICRTTAGTVGSVSQDWPTVTLAIQSGDAASIATLMRERDYRWPLTLPDPDASTLQQYGLRGVPAMIILTPGGQISSISLGYTSEIGLRLRLWWAGRQRS